MKLFQMNFFICLQLFFKDIMHLFFRERGRDGEREGEKHQCVREILIDCLAHAPQPGTAPTTQACALSRN